MTNSTSILAGRALGLGAVSGLRSMVGPALLSRAAARGELDGLKGTWFEFLLRKRVSTVLTLMALGEMVVDKSGLVPDRIERGPLAGRAVLGAVVGAALFSASGAPWAAGAALGSLAAVAAAYAGYNFRVVPRQRFGIPDLVLGLIEDAVAITAGSAALRRRSST